MVLPRMSPVSMASKSGTGRSALVLSLGSCPHMACSMIAASRTSLVIGPAWSSELAKGHDPPARAAPVGRLDPVMPVKAAGWRIDPPVSVPVAPRQRSAATAAADPPEEPPGVSLRSPTVQGFTASP